MAWRGWVGTGKAGVDDDIDIIPNGLVSTSGTACHGHAWLGAAMQDKAWADNGIGVILSWVVSIFSKACHGPARQGKAMPGMAGADNGTFQGEQMSIAKRHPFDYDALNKGDVIPASQIEHLCPHPPTDIRYGTFLMELQAQVQRELWSRGKKFTIKTERGGLRILTDAEASPYNHARAGGAIRKAVRCVVRNLAVDPSALNEAQRRDHEKFLYMDGRLVQAIASARPKLVPTAVRRNVPGLMG